VGGLLHDIANALGGRVSGDRAVFPTPGHSKKDLGSWATLNPGAPDGVLIHCSNGGDPLAIKDELRSRGILPKRRANDDPAPWRPPVREATPARQHAVKLAAGQAIVATFEFYGSDGSLLHRKHRIEPGDEGRDKTFRFDRPGSNGGWVAGQGDDRVPYRLPDLLAAPKDQPIYMAEGEAKADLLAEWDLLATSHKDWKGFEFSGYVRGRTVFILLDNDETGRRLAENAREAVETAGGTAYLIELPGLGEGEDILDWKGDRAELERLVDRQTALIVFDDAADWDGIHVPPRRWLLDGWLPIGEAALLTGAGSVGKSLVSQQLAATIAAGVPFMGVPVEQARTAYITCEDGHEEAQRRHQAIRAAIGAPTRTGECFVKSWKGELDLELATFDSERRLRPTKRFHALRLALLATGTRFVVLDNVSHFFGGDENVKREVAAFVNLMNGLAAEIDGVVLLLGHPNKTGLNKPDAGDANQFGGSVAWENQVRSRMFMEASNPDDPDARALSNPKANYSAKGNKLGFRWYRGAFARDDDLPADYAAELAQTIRANGDNERFLTCLAERNKQRRHVSEKPTAQNYAPKIFEAMPESKGIGRKRLIAAMDRLFRIERIERGFLYRDTAEGRDIHGLREVSDATREASENLSENLPKTPSENLRKPAENDREHPPIDKSITGAANGAAAPDGVGGANGCSG
jgi:RecA-family ATPase